MDTLQRFPLVWCPTTQAEIAGTYERKVGGGPRRTGHRARLRPRASRAERGFTQAQTRTLGGPRGLSLSY